ncbi:MAG: PD-(D/E)XK nuclease family protein [Phycisphaera sp.]|nr:MAG: PD-(D/E)XK nuclease family protein [Phycisphaera sp.]
MNEVLQISYTGDLLAHRRCPRSWAYEKYAGFHPYEQSQAMEGRLVHHAMEWLAAFYDTEGRHATATELDAQLRRHFRVLWARGIRTAFASKDTIVGRALSNIYPSGQIHATVKAAIEGAQHTEYELRAIRKLVAADFAGKTKMLLTGVLDLVVQQQQPLTYDNTWKWTDLNAFSGHAEERTVRAAPGDLEVWDYKGSRAASQYSEAFVLQLLTYAGLYAERAGTLPKRCVIFFVNEPKPSRQLLAIEITEALVRRAHDWTLAQARAVRSTMLAFEADPQSLEGGDARKQSLPLAKRVDKELAKQCLGCGQRFDCPSYRAHLHGEERDIDRTNVRTN